MIDTAYGAPETVWVAGDEASLYLQATLRVVWAARGQTPIVKLHPGREHTHFYGALNLHTGQEIAMQSPVMNAEASVLFLQKLLLTIPEVPHCVALGSGSLALWATDYRHFDGKSPVGDYAFAHCCS